MGGFWRRSPQKQSELKLGIELHSKETYNHGTYSPNEWYVRKPRSIIFHLIFPWLQFGYHGKRQPNAPKVIDVE